MVSRETIDVMLDDYACCLVNANKYTNLVSRRLTPLQIRALVGMFATLLTVTDTPTSGSLIDVGSGGGFPGIPLAIRYPGLDVVLNEERRIRIECLRDFVSVLSLTNANVLPGRIERLDTQHGFDVVTAFGVGQASDLIPVTTRLADPGGRVLMSIPNDPTPAERAGWTMQAALHGYRATDLKEVLNGTRSVLVLDPFELQRD